MSIFDSPLCKNGHVTILIHTIDKLLIQVDSEMRIPRTYVRFASLMTQLLDKLSIRAVDSDKDLIAVCDMLIEDYLPSDLMVCSMVV